MCNTTTHDQLDPVLVGFTAADFADPAVMTMVRSHSYDDACCALSLQGDGHIILRGEQFRPLLEKRCEIAARAARKVTDIRSSFSNTFIPLGGSK